MSGKLISVAVSDPDLIRSVDTIKGTKITNGKRKIKILHGFEEMDGLLIFLELENLKKSTLHFCFINFQL